MRENIKKSFNSYSSLKRDMVMVDILLSTYNGGRYLRDQLDSILSQSYQNWVLIIRDDGSSDQTFEIVNQYFQKYPDKIKIIMDKFGNIGPSQSYGELLRHSTAPYTMFCDQDDVWHPDKIKITLDEMINLEKKYSDYPILIHTDLSVVDNELRIINQSFWKYQHLNPNRDRFNHLLIQNVITGNTIMINRLLREKISSFPKETIMHDWWIGLVASAFGKIKSINKPTIYYRQHDSNDTGAKKYSFFFILKRFYRMRENIQLIKRTICQSKAFLESYKYLLEEEKYKVVNSFANILSMNRVTRIIHMYKNNFSKFGFFRNIGFIFFILLIRKESNGENNYFKEQGGIDV